LQTDMHIPDTGQILCVARNNSKMVQNIAIFTMADQ